MRFSILIFTALIGLAIASHGSAEADVAVGYSATYANSVGGADNLEVLVANTVAGSNAINERSGSPARMRVVGCYQSIQDNTNRTSTGGIVGWLANYDSRISDVVDFGNSVGADLVTYICTNNDAASISAVAQQPGRFSAFNPSSFWSTVFAHETGGHNYGCDHRGGDDNPKTVMMHNYCGGGAQGYFSNPNIWLNGSRLQGTGTCLGAAVNGGDNSYLLSTAAQGVADRYPRVVAAPNLGNVVRHWSFNQPAGTAPAGTTVTDSVSGTALATVQGTGATFTGAGLRLPGGASGSSAAYLQLPGALISGHTNITIEIWAKTLSVQNWARVMDFNNGTDNYITLTTTTGTNLNTQRFESKVNGATVTLDSGLPSATGVMHHFAVTFSNNGSGGGRWQWFRDGDAIAFLDVAYTLSALQDVNNWLGRSAYPGDALANCEYAEVRISNVAMTRAEVAANARLGPNRQAASANLTADDPIGQNSFSAAGYWSDGQPPSAGKSYETYGFRLRTPADGTSRTFAGQALALNGGSFTWKGTSSNTITVNDLTLGGTGGEVLNAGSGTWTLAGNLTVDAPEVIVRAANGPINLASNLSGDGSLLHVNNTVTLSGTNTAFTGKTIVGDGRFSSVSINSEARLGTSPVTFTADQLTLNRGILYSTNTMTLDDANRGIRIGESAGIFNVAPGTTLTLAVPLSSPSSGTVLQTTPQFPNPASGMLIKENAGTLQLTHPNNSHVGEIVINGGTLALSEAGRFNNGETNMPVVNNGALLIDTNGNQIFGGVISGDGSFIKNNTGTTTLVAANTLTGAVTINGGTLYANIGNAATNRALSHVSSITVNNGGTLRTSSNALFGWDGTQEKPITVHTGATLLADSNADVGLGTVTLAGGTLANSGPSTTWGSWRFDNNTDKLLVTHDSTVSATNVKFGNPAATIEVAADKTLDFTGTITDATSGGISYLTKTGPGTLTLAGSNTHTGATALNAGTTLVNGSLAAGSTVTVASGAMLGGNGTINGAATILGTHSPGNSPGTQTFGSTLTYGATSNIIWELESNSVSAGASDRVTASGAVTITAGAALDLVLNSVGSSVDFSHVFWSQPRSWPVLTGSSISGTFVLGTVTADPAGRPVSDYGSFSLQQSATTTSLVFTPYTPAEAWRLTHFSTIENSGDAANEADPDGDLVNNLLERAFAGDPNNPEHDLLPTIDDTAPLLSIVYRRSLAAADITFTVQESADLSAPWIIATGEASVLTEEGDVQKVRFTSPSGAAEKKFLRVQVSDP